MGYCALRVRNICSALYTSGLKQLCTLVRPSWVGGVHLGGEGFGLTRDLGGEGEIVDQAAEQQDGGAQAVAVLIVVGKRVGYARPISSRVGNMLVKLWLAGASVALRHRADFIRLMGPDAV